MYYKFASYNNVGKPVLLVTRSHSSIVSIKFVFVQSIRVTVLLLRLSKMEQKLKNMYFMEMLGISLVKHCKIILLCYARLQKRCKYNQNELAF